MSRARRRWSSSCSWRGRSETYATEPSIVRGRRGGGTTGMSTFSRMSVASLAVALAGAGYFSVYCGTAARSGGHTRAASSVERPPAAAQPAAPSPRALLDQYCVTCHNERLKTGGLSLDKVDIEHPGEAPEIWEKVAHKLRTGDMPPTGRPRPEPAVSMGLASYLEDGARQSGGRDPQRRARHAASAESDGIHERRPRPARPGDSGVAAADRELDRRLRQYRRGADGVADAARALHVARPPGESPRCW